MNEPGGILSPALGAWLALRRVDRGDVTLDGGLFLDGGRPVPGYLVAPLRLLLDRGHGSTDPPRVRITESGLVHYRELCRRRALWLATDRSVPFGLEVHS